MIKYKLFESINECETEDIILNIYNYKNKQINNCVFNSSDVLKIVCDLGKEILDIYLDKHSSKYVIENKIMLDDILEDKDLNDKYLNAVNEWIQENGFPYIEKESNNILIDSVICYIINQIQKIVYYKQLENIKRELNTQTYSKYSLKFYLTIIRDIVYRLKRIDTFTIFSHGIIDYIETYGRNSFINNYNKIVYNKNVELIDDNFVFILKVSLLEWILFRKYRDRKNFAVSKDYPIYNKKSKEFFFNEVASSLMGIAYQRLMINVTIVNFGYTKIPCRNEACNNFFTKTGKGEFCQACINKEIPRKIICRDYNKRRKKQTTSSPQTT